MHWLVTLTDTLTMATTMLASDRINIKLNLNLCLSIPSVIKSGEQYKGLLLHDVFWRLIH